jgi:predicted nuclease of predicted toxin-antitoxin system
MKFLLDSNLSHRVAQLLCDAGLDAVHVRDKGLQHATDSAILEFARQHAFVLVSEDTDFGELLARQRTAAPSFVLLRTYDPLTPDEQAAVLLANLLRLRDDLEQGAIVVIERSRLRVRRLPVLPPIPPQRER